MRSLHYLLGVGASKRLKVRRIFTQISPNLPQNTPKKTNSKKKQKNDYISFHVGRISSNQNTSNTIFAQISPNFPEETKSKHDLQKMSAP